MPRNMSFALTTEQFKKRTKWVTRRQGWKFVKAGDIINGCVKCMGLKPGEKIQRLGQIRVIGVRREELCAMNSAADNAEAVAEGFPDMTNQQFVQMFCEHMSGPEWQHITRIEFEYLDE